VAILDADKEGFLRTETSLIQTIGRAARNVNGKVIMYADHESKAMKAAISETERRRQIQSKYNEEHGITPASVSKNIRDLIEATHAAEEENVFKGKKAEEMTKKELTEFIKKLETEMKQAAKDLQFERAATLRDQVFEYKAKL
jgi:excinuclease ABC subunit B